MGGGSPRDPTHGNSAKQRLPRWQDMIFFVDLDTTLFTNQHIYIYLLPTENDLVGMQSYLGKFLVKKPLDDRSYAKFVSVVSVPR